MMKSSKGQQFRNATKLKLNHETLRVLDSRELLAAIGGASGGASSIFGTDPHGSADIGCCSL